MISQECQQFWQEQDDVWQVSDLSGAAFCKQHDLNCAQFNYGRKKFQPTQLSAKPADFTKMTQLVVALNRLSDGLRVHLHSGISFSGINSGNLDVVLAQLRQL